MNRIEKLQARIGKQGKSALNYTADLVKWSARKNLAVVEDIADFTFSQLRLPIDADGFASYSKELKVSYSDFGGVLKSHGGDYVAKFKDLPEEVLAIFGTKKTATRKAPAKAKAAKRKASKKAKGKVAKAKVAKPKATAAAKVAKPKATTTAKATKPKATKTEDVVAKV